MKIYILLLVQLLIYITFVNGDTSYSWQNVSLSYDYPHALDGSTAVLIGPWIYTIYGFNETIESPAVGSASNIFYDDIYAIHSHTGQTIRLGIDGDKPSKRAFVSAGQVHHDGDLSVLMYAGESYDYTTIPLPTVNEYNDAWVLNLRTLSWKQLDTTNTPSPRSLNAFVVINNKLIVHGGVHFQLPYFTPQNYQEMYSFDPQTGIFSELKQINQVMSPRHNHHFHYWENQNKIVSFGGAYAVDAQTFIEYTDVHTYDLDTGSWESHNVSLQETFGYSSLKQSVTTVIGDKLIIIGGDSGVGYPVINTKTIVYDLNTREFLIDSTNGPQLKRAAISKQYKHNYADVSVFGGYNWNNETTLQFRYNALFSHRFSL